MAMGYFQIMGCGAGVIVLTGLPVGLVGVVSRAGHAWLSA